MRRHSIVGKAKSDCITLLPLDRSGVERGGRWSDGSGNDSLHPPKASGVSVGQCPERGMKSSPVAVIERRLWVQ